MTQLLTSAEGIALEIQARLGAIRIANGCETDFGVRVFGGRRSIDDTMIPCVTLIEADDELLDHNDARGAMEPQVIVKQHYVLYAYLPCNPDHPNVVAHAAIRDMKRALFRTAGVPDSSFGRKVKKVRYVGRDISPRADGSTLVVAAIEITVEFVETLSTP